MKTKYLYIAVLALGLCGFSSCKDFLDHEPDERVEIETEEQVLQLLCTAYMDSNYGWVCELSSDNMIDNNSPHMPADSKAVQREGYYNLPSASRADDELFAFQPVVSSTDSDYPSGIWSGAYGAIATANHALMYIEQISKRTGMTPKLKAARAEALLTRAYHHFVLVNIFCQAYKDEIASREDVGIPYIVKPENTVYVHAERGDVASVYKNIEADLEEGLKDVTDTYYDMPKWRFNVNAAHAFAARFYLYCRKYEKVVEHANFVLGAERNDQLLNKLMNYKAMDDCTNGSDYALAWQGANVDNNLMLIATHSRAWRKFAGYRYAINGIPLRSINYRSGPTWGWTIQCAGSASGATFYRGNSDYGFVWAKVAESFEYTDKVAGIGFAHVIRREFTGNSLLLDRAEAELMLGNIDNCYSDLYWFEESRHNFSEATYTKYYSNGSGLKELTKEMIEKTWFSSKSNLNCDFDWSSTQRMSASYVITKEAEPYMNCLNDYRRWETAYEGYRFFDLKRWGIEYKHVIGYEKQTETLTWDDPRRAIEVPNEVLAAGLSTSRPESKKKDAEATLSTSMMLPVNND